VDYRFPRKKQLMDNKVPVGIDMSKASFHAEMKITETVRKRREFSNDLAGFQLFVQWCFDAGVDRPLVLMEATGRCVHDLCKYLYTVGIAVRVANPKRIRRFAEALGLLGKSDKADAHAITEYAAHHWDKVRDWKPQSQTRVALQDIRCHVIGLQKARQSMKNRLGSGISDAGVVASLNDVISMLDAEIEKAMNRATELIRGDFELNNDRKLLETQIGVAEVTSLAMLTRIDFRAFSNSRQVARFCGLTANRQQSGTSINRPGRISKEGPSDLRAVLFNAARSAMTHDPSMRAFVDRLKARGKCGMLILVAVMRKIVMRSWALVTKGIPFDVCYSS
jgi:transposase